MASVKDKKAIEAYLAKLKQIGESADVDYNESDAEKKAVVARAKKEYGFFVQKFFPHYAKSECATFQIEEANRLLATLDICLIEEWARGLAKSTHFDIFIPIWLHLFHDQMRCMLLVGKNQESAKRLLSDVQAEFEANPQLIHYFGKLTQNGSWEDGNFYTTTGCAFFALGKGQSPRGLRNGPYRPDLVILDDADDDEECRNPKRVDASVNWVLRALIPAMAASPCRFVMVNNRIGTYTILTNLAENKNFRHRVVNALDKNGNPNWPEQYSKEFYEKRLAVMGWPQFNTEYMNSPTWEGKYFKGEYFQWVEPLRLNQYERIVAYWDLAYSESKSADYNAITIVGLKGVHKHVLKAFVRQCKMEDAIRWASYVQISLPKTVIIEWYAEGQFWSDAVEIALQTVAKEFGFRMPFVFMDRPGRGQNKFARILEILPGFQRLEWYFNAQLKHNADMQRLIEQTKMIEPGSGGHDDGPDALAGAGSKLESGRKTPDDSYPTLGRDSNSGSRVY